jgi:hypothetical protein
MEQEDQGGEGLDQGPREVGSQRRQPEGMERGTASSVWLCGMQMACRTAWSVPWWEGMFACVGMGATTVCHV